MTNSDKSVTQDLELRWQTEVSNRRTLTLSPESIGALSPEEARQMLQSLHTHQIELEMQNEELRRTQLELDAARARYFELYDLAPVGYCTISERGLILQANLTAAALLGVPRGLFNKQRLTQYIYKEDQDIYYLHCQQLNDTIKPQTCELRMVKSSGTQFWACLSTTVTVEAESAPVYRVVLSDVTERKRAEEKQRASEESLAVILQSIGDAVIATNNLGRITHMNATAELLTGKTLEYAVGRRVVDVFPLIDAEALTFVLETGQARGFESTTRAANQTPLWFSSHISSMRRNGDHSGAVIISRDVTEKKRNEALLIASDRMATVGIVAAGVAHEINNPLAAIIANLELALQGVTDLTKPLGMTAELRGELSEALDCAERIRTIVRDVKVFSWADEGASVLVDTRDLLESTIRVVWNEVRHRACVVKEYGEVPLVDANGPRLGQVFLNLLVNAAHAIPEGQAESNEIRVSTRLDKSGYVVIEIADTGAGMSPEVQRRIFTPFFTTKPIGVGTGLGLAICQRIVTDLGGRVECESTLGKGTAFRVYLPSAQSKGTPNIVSALAVPTARRRGKILVIDDERPLLTIMRKILSEHDIITAISAREALDQILAGEVFDVIFCDLMMPVMTGMELHAKLMRFAPAAAEKMIFMTGGAFTAKAQEFLGRVSNLQIEKPFDQSQLRTLVNQRVL